MLFPEFKDEEPAKEMYRLDHLVGKEIYHKEKGTVKFLSQYKCPDGNIKYKIVNPEGRIEMVNKKDITTGKATVTRVKTTKVKKKEPEKIVLSADQQFAYDYIMSQPIHDQSLFFFLTGEAGTGKTTLVNYIKKRHRCRMTASTGLASQHIGGTTIYRFLGIRPMNVAKGIPAGHEKVTKSVGNAEVIFVDEVSMIEAKLFRLIVKALEYFKVRVVFVGDFFQLPPVNGSYCFDTWEWKQRVLAVSLNTNHRQNTASNLAHSLNCLRWGMVTDHMRNLIADRTVEELPEDCVNIMPKRKDVATINRKRLEELNNKIFTYEYKISYKAPHVKDSTVKSLIESGRIPPTLDLAVGARVIFLTNDQEGRWVNGTLGTIKSIEHGKYIDVRADRGYTITVDAVDHEILDGDGEQIAVYRQLPMDLAWAMTIHKAQGTSLDKVGIDMNNHFAPGMTYVAISRCKTEEGLHFVGRLDTVLADPRVDRLYRSYAGG